MIRKIVLFIALAPLFVQAQTGNGQEKSNAVYKTVSKQLEDDKKLYDKLLKRFVDNDTTLTDEEMNVVYYGAVFQKNYNPYSTHKKEKKFFNYYNNTKFKKALRIGEKILKKEPLNFKIVFKLLACAYALKDEKKIEKYGFYYAKILNTILSSGDGLSPETAFVVIDVDHERTFISQLGLSFSNHRFVGVCDKFEITDKGDDFEGDEIWFDLSKSIEHISKILEK